MDAFTVRKFSSYCGFIAGSFSATSCNRSSSARPEALAGTATTACDPEGDKSLRDWDCDKEAGCETPAGKNCCRRYKPKVNSSKAVAGSNHPARPHRKPNEESGDRRCGRISPSFRNAISMEFQTRGLGSSAPCRSAAAATI